ncbi:peptidylprolyl isomerase [Kangiella sp. TOML190]|uniref:peptidylprolyl isomerase n=1 Tax=Kangiella sp. TOML190 TaxID=2931351 RepID=UPI0035DE480E
MSETMQKVTLTTNHGNIVLELNAEKAPKTVENFLNYVRNGHYDGTIFHRVISNFMIQGGSFTPDMEQKDTQSPIENEANNGLSNVNGSIAMARTMDPHSASCQFFINTKDNDFLNFSSETSQGWGYCVFGQVVEGMDVVDSIKEVETGSYSVHQDVPVESVMIEKAIISE